MPLDLPPELEAQLNKGFDDLADKFVAEAKSEDEAETAPAVEETEPTSEPVAAAETDVEKQEKEQVKDGPPPTDAASGPADSPDPLAAFYESQPKDYRDLVEKYRAGGMSLADAMVKANTEQSTAYWEVTRAKSAEAKAQKQPEVQAAPAAPATPEPTSAEAEPPEIREIDQRVGVLRSQMAGLLKSEDEYKKSLAAIEDAEEKIKLAILTQDLEFDAETKAKAELRRLLALRNDTRAYLSSIAEKKQGIEDRYDSLEVLKKQTQKVIAIERAREAEVKEREARAVEAQKAEAQSRWKAASDAWDTNLPTITNEGDPVPQELLGDFKELALKHIYDSTNGNPPAPADVPKLMREAKAKFDQRIELAHRVRSRTFAERKEKDLQVVSQAPDGKAAQAPAVKRRNFASDEEFEAHLNRAWDGIRSRVAQG